MSDEIIATDDFLSFMGIVGDDISVPPSEDFRKTLSFYKDRLDEMDRDASDEEVLEAIKYLGPNASLNLIKRLSAYYYGRKRYIACDVIPSLFVSMGGGAKSIEFIDGSKVEVDTKFECRLAVEDSMSDEEKAQVKADAAAWVIKTGHADAIKTKLEFGKGEFDDKARALLESANYHFSVDESVHPSTLKKIVKDVFTATSELPPGNAIKFRSYQEAVFGSTKKNRKKDFW